MVAAFNTRIAPDEASLDRLSDLFRKIPNASVSVFRSKPFLQASLLDMQDGSSFDVVLAPDESGDKLLIVPQLRATEAAVSRLCRFLYEKVGEASFEDAEGTRRPRERV